MDGEGNFNNILDLNQLMEAPDPNSDWLQIDAGNANAPQQANISVTSVSISANSFGFSQFANGPSAFHGVATNAVGSSSSNIDMNPAFIAGNSLNTTAISLGTRGYVVENNMNIDDPLRLQLLKRREEHETDDEELLEAETFEEMLLIARGNAANEDGLTRPADGSLFQSNSGVMQGQAQSQSFQLSFSSSSDISMNSNNYPSMSLPSTPTSSPQSSSPGGYNFFPSQQPNDHDSFHQGDITLMDHSSDESISIVNPQQLARAISSASAQTSDTHESSAAYAVASMLASRINVASSSRYTSEQRIRDILNRLQSDAPAAGHYCPYHGYHHTSYDLDAMARGHLRPSCPFMRSETVVGESSATAERRARNEEIIRNTMELFRRDGITIFYIDQYGTVQHSAPLQEHNAEGEEYEDEDELEDMRIDLDDMTYEDLLDLEDQIGEVSTGLSEGEILANLRSQRYIQLGHDLCVICQEEFENGQVQGKLACGHDYHFECIKRWLAEKNSCPVCKKKAFPA